MLNGGDQEVILRTDILCITLLAKQPSGAERCQKCCD